MRAPNMADVADLLADRKGPCVSIYMPTARTYPDNQQNHIRFKDLLRSAEESLRKGYPGNQVNDLLEPARQLLGNQFFWTDRVDGLAVLFAPGEFHAFDVQRTLPELAVVADNYHLRPILRIVQSSDRFQVLGASSDHIRFYEGNRDALDEVEPKGVPTNVVDALGSEVTLGREVVGAYGKNAGGTHHAPGRPDVPANHAAEGADAKLDAAHFFEVVDKAIWENCSRRSQLPLVLVALPQNQSAFRAHSHNTFLVPQGVERSPESLSREELRQEVWKVMEPHYRQRLAKWCEEYGTARSRGQGSDDVAEVARAAHSGRVGMLLVDADRTVPGKIDRSTGKVQPANLGDPHADDVLDDVAEMVLRAKGGVIVVPHASMPTTTGLAAIYRY